MIFWRQLLAALQANLQLARTRHLVLIAFGLLVTATTLLVLLSIPAGLARLSGQSGLKDVVVVLPSGARTEASGTMDVNAAALVAAMPGVAHDRNNKALVDAQFVLATRLQRHDGSTATVLLRGVTPVVWSIVGNSITVTSGRKFRSGHNEALVGVGAARGFAGLAGKTAIIQSTPWDPVGQFSAAGGFWESEVWMDAAALQSINNTQGLATSLWVKLVSMDDFESFRAALAADPRTRNLRAIPQQDYYRQQTAFLDAFLRTVTLGIALALGAGALLATLNALSMAMTARRRQLAILRAIGFRQDILGIALLIEVACIAMVCGAVISLVGWLLIDGRVIGSSTGTQAIQFHLLVDSRVCLLTMGFLLLIALSSALRPTWQAVNATLVSALVFD